MSEIRTGQYVNIFAEDLSYDAYVIFAECADEINEDTVDAIQEALTPVLEKKSWSKAKKKLECEEILSGMEDSVVNLGWGYDVIIN